MAVWREGGMQKPKQEEKSEKQIVSVEEAKRNWLWAMKDQWTNPFQAWLTQVQLLLYNVLSLLEVQLWTADC